MAQIKQEINISSLKENNELITLQNELDELKLDFGKKQGEFQKVCNELTREREENKRRENMFQIETRRMEEEIREKDELLKEMTETSDELGRALNEANNELQNIREKFIISQKELQQKTEGNVLSMNNESLNKQFEQEINELKINLKLAEQKNYENDILLSQKNNELKLAEDKIVILEKKIENSNQSAEDFEQKFSLIAVNNTELKSQLKATELALESDKSKHLEFLEKIKKEFELKAKLDFEESEEKINKGINENTRLSDLLINEQKRNDLLREELNKMKKENENLNNNYLIIQKNEENNNKKEKEELKEINNKINYELQIKVKQLEEENTKLSSQLLFLEKKSEKDIKQQNNNIENLKIELENLKELKIKIEEENKIIKQQQFELIPPTAKPRKTLNNNNNGNSNNNELDEEGEITKIKTDLEKQRRLVTVLRKKLQQQQLDDLKQKK